MQVVLRRIRYIPRPTDEPCIIRFDLSNDAMRAAADDDRIVRYEFH